MGEEEFHIGSGKWSQLSGSSRCSSSPPPSSCTYAWPIQAVDVTKHPPEQPLHDPDHPNLQNMMGLALPSQPVEWNQPSLFRGIEKSDESCSFRSMLQEDNDHSSSSTTSFQQAEQQWPPRSQKIMIYSSSPAATADSEGVFSSFNPSQFMSTTHHHHLNPNNIVRSSTSTTGGFQIDSSSSIRYQNNPSTTSMLPGLLGYESNHQPPQQHSTPSMSNFTSYTSFGMNSSLSSDHDHQQLMLQPDSWQGSNISKPQNQLHLSNNAPFWNASPAAPIINHDVRSNLFPSLQMHSPSSTLDEKPKKSSSSETSHKRPRNETTSPLPAKAKKEKMGDRITALQQLVSPFGKTDTASVLTEAIEYIKFLHEQVSVLGNAYMKSGAPIQQQKCEKSNDQEGQQQDLRSRGLCLVPVSSTFAVTHETTVDFWNPTFGGSFR